MRNLIQFENFGPQELEESNCYSCSGMSEHAKLAIESMCEELLKKEAQDYHEDEDESHTYENYVNECSSYMKEIMGQPGYQALTKTYAE